MAASTTGTRRAGQKGVPRRGGTPRPPPGLAKRDPREEPDFLTWQAEYNSLGTVPEWMVFRWLERRKGFKHGIDFLYQVPFGGGRQVFGAVVTDFTVQTWLAWAVNGNYWHNRRGPEQDEKDELARARLESLGYTYVEVLDLDILERIDATLEAAMEGIEQPGAREGR